jgi:hypothetical protein
MALSSGNDVVACQQQAIDLPNISIRELHSVIPCVASSRWLVGDTDQTLQTAMPSALDLRFLDSPVGLL